MIEEKEKAMVYKEKYGGYIFYMNLERKFILNSRISWQRGWSVHP